MRGGVQVKTSQLWAAVAAAAQRIKENRQYLTELDSAIGDADHGINMDRGFQAVLAKEEELTAKSPGDLLKGIAMTLLSTVGGAAGPLYGTLFLRMGTAFGDKKAVDPRELAEALAAGVQGVQDRGKAELGDKTMVDALLPAAEAMAAAAGSGEGVGGVLAAGSKAARKAAEATKEYIARRGRASYLGERSIGHIDPGAMSATLILEAMAEALTEGN